MPSWPSLPLKRESFRSGPNLWLLPCRIWSVRNTAGSRPTTSGRCRSSPHGRSARAAPAWGGGDSGDTDMNVSLKIVDDFYPLPEELRACALALPDKDEVWDGHTYRGWRRYEHPGFKQVME